MMGHPNQPVSNQQSESSEQALSALSESNQSLSFDPNLYDFLVYDPHNSSDSDIQRAMRELGISNYDVRSKDNPVTALDLSTHNILIVGWNDNGDMSGLHSDIIKAGIQGRVLLTGQDADYHTANTLYRTPAAKTFLSQAIAYILNGSGTGLLALGDYSQGMQWLPEDWGITTTYGLVEETILSFTTEGLASGIFDGITPEEMSSWGNSYHNTFDTWGLGFSSFELGGSESDPDTIVIGAQYSPIGLTLTKEDDVSDGDCRSPLETITYTLNWTNPTSQTFSDVSIIDFLPAGVNFDEFVEGVVYQPITPPPADPNVIYGITDANDLTDIILPVGQSIRLYLTKETFEKDVLSFYLEADISDPNLGWIDNTEYDPNNPGTAEILAQPRATFFDYYGPGYTQPEGIQFFAANLGNAIQDGNLASFVYTATQPGCVVLTLVDYDAVPATLEEIVIRQTDPNDPNYVPEEANEIEEPPVYSASSVSGVYNEPNHTVTWELGDIAPGSYGSVSFSVIVNEKSEPGMNLHNVAEAYTGQTLMTRASVDTLVCCWDTGAIIYVDKTANGNANGIDWANAYTDLQDALYRAENSACEDVNTIYAAQGEYSPGTREMDSFVLPDGVSVYGGFKPGGCDFEQRNPKLYITTLTGRIDPNNRNETVVTMGDDTLLDGFVIEENEFYGIYGEYVDFSIENCIIQNSSGWGVYASNGNIVINWCSIVNNNNGIFHLGINKDLDIGHCEIIKNTGFGIYAENNTILIKHSVIWKSSKGLQIKNPNEPPTLYNNTIGLNEEYGISFSDNHNSSGDPNFLDYPDMDSCIVWYNEDQILGFNPDSYAFNCCIQDCNEVNSNYSFEPVFAYTTEPNNIPDPNNYHLAWNSPCRDLGNPSFLYEGEVDIDGEDRVFGAYVDIGADEIYSCDNDLSEDDIFNVLDWNADGRVNYEEFNQFSRNWLAHDPNDPAVLDPNNPVNDPNSPSYIDPNRLERWYPDGYKYNLSTEGDSLYAIDIADLLAFIGQYPDTDHWLWVACWRHDIQEMQQMSMFMGNNGNEQLAQSEPVLSEAEGMMVFSAPSISMEISPPVETTISVPMPEPVSAVETDPAAEREQTLSLLEDIDALINAGGDDTEAWQGIKILLEQTLVETEDTANDPNEF
jgi:hypothetical protein